MRVEVRAASHTFREPRSGAVVIDIHDIHFSNGTALDTTRHGLRFADTNEYPELAHIDKKTSIIAGAHWQRLVFGYALPGESRTISLLSLGQRGPSPGRVTGSPTLTPDKFSSARPSVTVSQSSSRPLSALPDLTTLVLTVDVPSVAVKLSKNEVDGLQLWADDISRITETAFSSLPNSASSSRDPSLIGSRFFAKSRRSDGSVGESMSTSSAQRTRGTKETIVKVNVGEGMSYQFYQCDIHS